MITNSNNTASNNPVSSIDLTRPIEKCTPLVPDILNIIFSQSDIKSLGNISSVSREWHVESGKDITWQAHKGEFNVEGPNIKAKIKASIPTIEELFNEIFAEIDKQNLYPEKKAFTLNLVKILFTKGNIRSIQIENLSSYKGKEKWFTIILKEVKQINFNNSDIFNIVIPKKVLFSVFDRGLDFVKIDYTKDTVEHFPIQINNKKLSFGINKCKSLYIDFEEKFITNCCYESKVLAPSQEVFKTDKTLLDTIKK